MARGNALRILRQASVMIVALMFAGGTYIGRARTVSWEETLWVGIYPVAADPAGPPADYVAALTAEEFDSIAAFIAREAARYGVALERPVRVDLGTPLTALPPPPPDDANPLRVALWSLHLRWWAWRATRAQPGPAPDIRLFAVFHDPAGSPRLPHSLGLRESLIGVAHVFARQEMAGSNNVVLAHELLHTLGASDKYRPADNLPRFPEGYAEPAREPLYPQRYAEIMGGRIPVSATEARIPPSLGKSRIGAATAAELRWPVPPRDGGQRP